MLSITKYPGMTETVRDRLSELGIDHDAQMTDLCADGKRCKKIQSELAALEAPVALDLLQSWSQLAQPNPASLTPDEYWQWVHDHISHRVLGKLGKIISICGITGAIAVGAIVSSFNKMSITTSLTAAEDKLGEEIKDVTLTVETRLDDFEDSLDTKTVAAVVAALTEHTALEDAMRSRAREALSTEFEEGNYQEQVDQLAIKALQGYLTEDLFKTHFENALEEKDTKDRIVKSAVDSIGTDQGLDKIVSALARQLEPVVLNPNKSNSLRLDALQLLSIFAREGPELKRVIKTLILSNDSQDAVVKADALRRHQPDTITAANTMLIQDVFTLWARSNVEADLDADAYTEFFRKFPSELHADQLAGWVSRNPSHTHAEYVRGGLAGMQGDHQMPALVGLALHNDGAVREHGLLGLNDLDLDSVAPATRWQQITRLWESLTPEDRVLPTQSPVYEHIEKLAEAIRSGDRERVRVLSEESQNLSHVDNLRFFYSLLLTDEEFWRYQRGDFNTVERLTELFNLSDDVLSFELGDLPLTLSHLIRWDDWDDLIVKRLWPAESPVSEDDLASLDLLLFCWAKSIPASDQASDSDVRNLIERAAEKVITLPDALYFRGMTQVLQAAMARNVFDVRQDILRQFTSRFHGSPHQDTERDFLGASVIARALALSIAEPEHPWVTRLVEQLCEDRKKYQAILPDVAKIFTSQAIMLLPADQVYDRIEVYNLALQLEPRDAEFLVKRSLVYLHHGDIDKARVDLLNAIEHGAEITQTEALQYVKLGDEVCATKAVNASILPSDEGESHASKLENLGVYYLRTEQWQKAFDHTEIVNGKHDANEMTWNLLVRAIAAYRIGDLEEAERAFAKWTQNSGGNIGRLGEYVQTQYDAYLEDKDKANEPAADDVPEEVQQSDEATEEYAN